MTIQLMVCLPVAAICLPVAASAVAGSCIA